MLQQEKGITVMVQNKKNENQTEVMAGEQSVCF